MTTDDTTAGDSDPAASGDDYAFTLLDGPELQLQPSPDGGRTGSIGMKVTSRLNRAVNAKFRVAELDDREPDRADGSWISVEPDYHFLRTGEEHVVTATANVPPGTPSGTYRFRLGAYADDNQQEEFTLSQVLSMNVAETAAPKREIPWWIIAAAAAVLVLLLGIGGWMLLGGGDEAPNLIAQPVAAAEAEWESLTVVPASASGADDQCVLFQVPLPTEETSDITALAVPCPQPAPEPAVPDEVDEPCGSFSFCTAVADHYPEPESNPDWQEARLAMTVSFIESFTIPGAETPDLIGLSLIEARTALQGAGLGWNEIDDGGPGEQCRDGEQLVGRPVLLQHPYAGHLTASSDEVSIVLTSCPDEVNFPEEVVIESLVNVNDFGNLPAAVPPFARSLVDDPNLGQEYVTSPQLAVDLGDQVNRFRQRFAVPRVPDVVGLRLESGQQALEALGLEWAAEDPAFINEIIFGCPFEQIVSQSIAPDTAVAELNDPVVNLTTIWTSGPCVQVAILDSVAVSEALTESQSAAVRDLIGDG